MIVAGDDPRRTSRESDVNDRFFGVTGFRSMIIAPISGEAGPLGALEVYSTEPGAFDDDDAGVIRSLAYQAAIAIQNARLIEELDRSREEIARRAETEQSLREIAARITAIREPGDLLQHVVEEAARLLDSDGAIIDLLDPVTGTIEWGYDSGIDEERRLPLARRRSSARTSSAARSPSGRRCSRPTTSTTRGSSTRPTRTSRPGRSACGRWRSPRSSRSAARSAR